MNCDRGKDPDERGITFVPTSGSLVGGMMKEKTARITDAMSELQLGIDGLRMQLPSPDNSEQWTRRLAAFARICSVFLRKTVLGDFGKRRTRLLDDRVLDSTGLRLDRLRRIPRDERRWIEVGFGIAGGGLEITKLDDLTREPDATDHLLVGAQSVEFAIEWPLPGAADWTGVPCEDSPWPVSPDQLFRTGEEPGLSCDEWLGQQVVLFDGKGISLKEMIRTVVNFEGAHSINVGRLATVEGEKPSRAAANPAPHILNAITFCDIRYADLIVIECALYLYGKLLKEDSIERPSGEIYMLTPCVACSPDQAESPSPNWVKYLGKMMISFSDAPGIKHYEIKAVR